MTTPEGPTEDRAELAFRQVLTDLPAAEGVDPAGARRTATHRRNRRLVIGGVAAVAVLVVGAVGLPGLLRPTEIDVIAPISASPSGPPASGSPAPVPADPAPAGWRTEYYRSLSFAVPTSWGYAYEPGSAWCAGSADGKPRPEHRQPYVSLGGPSIVETIACPEQPESLLTEHVATTARFEGDTPASGTTRRGDWLLVQQVFPQAVLVVTTRDEALAKRIIASAKPAAADAPCGATSPVQGPLGARPEPGVGLAELTGIRGGSICQYDPDTVPDDPLAGLRARRSLTGAEATALMTRLAAAPKSPSCAPDPDYAQPEIAVVVRIWSEDGVHDVFVQASGCEDSAMTGGIDDGETVRLLTRGACRALLIAPITLEGASGGVATSCLD